MAIGKNRKLGKKGRKKKAIDPFLKKEWYIIQAPNHFTKRDCGQTLVTRSQGTKIASDSLKGRVFEVNLADLNQNEPDSFRKIKLIAEDVQGNKVLTNFYGMDLTRDKEMSLMKKWQSMIEARVDVKTADGYVLRLFSVAFTMKDKTQLKKFCYAQTNQKKALRKKMVDIMTESVKDVDLKEVVQKFIPGAIGEEMRKSCNALYPVKDVYVRKVKVLKRPKFDLIKLMEVHGETKGITKEENFIGDADEVTGGGGRY